MPPAQPPRVSCSVTKNGLDALQARRWRPPVNWEKHGLSEATLRDPRAKIPLEDYITYHRALARPVDDAPTPLPREHRRVGRELMTHGAESHFRHITSLATTVPTLYKAVFGWLFMSQMPMIRCLVTHHSAGHLSLLFELDESYPDSECLFHSFAGSAEMLPLMLKSAPSEVSLEAGSHRALLEVRYSVRPPLRTRLALRLMRAVALRRGGSNSRRVYQDLMNNITMLEQSNRALQESQARWRALNKHLPGAVWLLNDEGQVVESSGVLAGTLLPARTDGAPRLLLDAFAPSSHLPVEDALRRLRAGAPSVDFEATTASGDRVLSCTGGPAPLQDATTLVFAQDVTARRDAELTAERSRQRLATARRMEAIGRLAAGLAHDTNNLLMNIRGAAQLLALERTDDVEVQEATERIISAVDRADELTRNALSPGDTARETPSSADLTQVLVDFHQAHQRPGVRLVLLAPPPGDLQVGVSESLLQRVLLNLVLNARQAMESSGVGDEITLRVRLTPSHQVKLSVHDNGPGMDPSTLSRAFEPFFTTRTEGSGLGLSNSWWSLRQLGGDLVLRSAPGEGTTAVVSLPVVQTQPQPAASESQKRTVLLVDDEPELRDVVRKVLETLNLEVLEAGSGAEALAHLETLTSRPALLVSDLTLPRSSGRRVAADVRGQFPDVPVLFLSGVPELEGYQSAQESHAAFLRKPFRIEALQQTIARLIE